VCPVALALDEDDLPDLVGEALKGPEEPARRRGPV